MSSLDTNVIEHSHGSEARTEALQEENGSVFLAQQRQGPGGQEQQFTGREPKSHRLSSLHDLHPSGQRFQFHACVSNSCWTHQHGTPAIKLTLGQ